MITEEQKSIRNVKVRFLKSGEKGIITTMSNELKPNVNYAVRVEKEKGYKFYYVTGDKLEVI